MPATAAPGWGADWLNAWLAAIGATVLVPGLRLSWTPDPVPTACFQSAEGNCSDAIAAALPTLEYLNGLSITKRLEGALELPRKVSHPAYQDRARVARQAADPFLGATLTDLKEPLKDELPHSPFDPPVPRGITLSERLIACREAIGERGAELVSKSLAGTLSRVAANGLGFDARRFPSGVQPGAGPMVDPVVECLAFFGLALFPVRGNGPQIRTRGWKDWEFGWVAWSSALDCWGIDALLDQVQAFAPDTRAARESLWRLGVLTRYRSVAFQPVGSADTRRGYASRRVE